MFIHVITVSKLIKQKLTEMTEEIDNTLILIGGFNTAF